MRQDLKVAWRFLIKGRTSTIVSILTLGIAIAVSTTAIGLLDQALWRPLGNEENLATLYNARAAAPRFQVLSYPDYAAIRDRIAGRVDLAAFVRIARTVGGADAPATTWGEIVSGNYFSVLGGQPFLGRLLSADDDRAADECRVVLAHSWWHSRFHDDRTLIGESVRMGRQDCTVVGVASPVFRSPAYPSNYWLSQAAAVDIFGRDLVFNPRIPLFQTIARLRPDVTLAEVDSIVRGIDTTASRDGWQLTALPGRYLRFWPAYRSDVARFVGVFVALGLALLLVSCANLAGLLVARSGERQRELAVRQALGATRMQLARRLAAESLVLTACGGVLGMWLAYWTAGYLTRVPMPVPAPIGVTFDLRLAAIAVGVSFLAALLFTVLSAVKPLRDTGIVAVEATARATAGLRAGRVLVASQVAIGCVLLSIGGLLARTAWNVSHVDVGFETSDQVIGAVDLNEQGYSPKAGIEFFQRLQDALLREPSVEAAAFGQEAPVGRIRVTNTFAIAGSHDDVRFSSRYNVVSAGYFATLGIPLLRGREFSSTDTPASEPVAIVNEQVAARFPDGVLGRLIRIGDTPVSRRIVGVAREIKYNGITEPSQPFVYLPASQAYRPYTIVHVRTRSRNADALLRSVLRSLDPHVPISDVRTMTAQIAEARASQQVAAEVSTGAAGLTMFLAIVGIYGVLTTSVEQRRRELAIRSALGATPGAIVTRVVTEGTVLTAAGLLVGCAISLFSGRLVARLLYQVDPRDALVLTIAPAVVFVASALAWLAPARRAARVDPASALRAE
jgi:predicted permease